MTGKAPQKPAGSGPAVPPPATTADAPPEADGPCEVGGRKGPEPTRYGDWEVGGICSDF